MRVTKSQLSKIVEEEIKRGSSNNSLQLVESDQTLGQMATEQGIKAALDLLKSSSGRNLIADILVFLPDLIKWACGAGDSISSLFGDGILSKLGSAGGVACRASVSVIASPLYGIAYALRKLDDKGAEKVINGFEANRAKKDSKKPDASKEAGETKDPDDGTPPVAATQSYDPLSYAGKLPGALGTPGADDEAMVNEIERRIMKRLVSQ